MASADELDRGVFRSTLPGGTEVLSERMESVRSVAIGFWFRQGRIHEPAAEGGVSHLLEHMVFKGTSRRSARDLAWELERLGGALDAYTTHESTAFQARVPAHHLDTALDVLVDLSLQPLLRHEDLALEREVVLEEIAATEETPEEVAFESHASFLYGGHPYGEPIIGTQESVERLTRESLVRVHEEAYRPSNLIVAAAGAVDHEVLIGRLGEALPADGGPTPRREIEEPRGTTGQRRIRREGGRQAHIVTGGMTVPYADPLRYAVVVASTALGGGMSSRLFQRIREEHGLAYSVYSYHCFFAGAGHAGAYVGTRPETAGEAREALFEQLHALATGGLGDDELADTRSQLKGQTLLSLESPAARMSRLAGVALYDQPYQTLDEVAARIDEVDADRCRAAAAFFEPARAATLELSPT